MTVERREYREIPIDQIDADDYTFLISYPRVDESLRLSVSQLGLLNPLSVRRTNGEKLQMIAGFKRLSACLDNKIKKVPALIYPEGLNPLSAFGLAVHDNLNRGYNLIEKGSILKKLLGLFHAPLDSVISSYMPLLGLNPGHSLLRHYMSLQNLAEDMKRYIYETEMPLSCAARIASYNGEGQEALLEFLDPLRPGVNKLREILTNAEESAAREGVSIAQLLSRKEFDIVRDPHLPRPQKIEMARAALKKLRFPQVSATEGMLEELIKSLRLPPGIAFHFPPYLEGDTIRAELRFTSPEELQRLVEKLMDASKREDLKKLCELL